MNSFLWITSGKNISPYILNTGDTQVVPRPLLTFKPSENILRSLPIKHYILICRLGHAFKSIVKIELSGCISQTKQGIHGRHHTAPTPNAAFHEVTGDSIINEVS